METENDAAIYFLTNYGKCKLAECQCISQTKPRFEGAWGGLACPDWEPMGARSMLELIEQAKQRCSNEFKD